MGSAYERIIRAIEISNLRRIKHDELEGNALSIEAHRSVTALRTKGMNLFCRELVRVAVEERDGSSNIEMYRMM